MGCTGAVPALGHQASPRPRRGPTVGPSSAGPLAGQRCGVLGHGQHGGSPGGVEHGESGLAVPSGPGRLQQK